MEEGILNSKIACSLERKDLVLIQQKAVSGVEWVRDAEMWEETQFGKSLTHQSWRGGAVCLSPSQWALAWHWTAAP